MAQPLLPVESDSHKESTVILFQNLNFWTAVGQIGLGLMFGVAVGIVLKRVTRLARPPLTRPEERICPGCGTPSLQRVRGTCTQRALSVITRKWPYACMRCPWPAVPRPERKQPFTFKRRSGSAQAAAVEAEMLPLEIEPIEAPLVEPAQEPELSPAPTRVTPKDDAAQVKDSVYHYVALLNVGDVSARANCYLSEFTSFAIDGGPLVTNRFEGRSASGPIQTFDVRCRDLRVYVNKDTAIATAYLVGTIVDSNGTPTRVAGRSSWVHMRQNGEWKIAHSHLSPLNPDA